MQLHLWCHPWCAQLSEHSLVNAATSIMSFRTSSAYSYCKLVPSISEPLLSGMCWLDYQPIALSADSFREENGQILQKLIQR